MAKAYEFLANGFEDIEALAPVDILRRGGVEVKTVSISDSLMVESANGVLWMTFTFHNPSTSGRKLARPDLSVVAE